MWKLFIDDERMPSEQLINENVEIARNIDDVIRLIEKHNSCPTFISFDHDLGSNTPSGKDIANYLVEKDLDLNGLFIPDNFSFYVHSQNNVGKDNIEGLFNSYLNHKKTNKFKIK